MNNSHMRPLILAEHYVTTCRIEGKTPKRARSLRAYPSGSAHRDLHRDRRMAVMSHPGLDLGVGLAFFIAQRHFRRADTLSHNFLGYPTS